MAASYAAVAFWCIAPWSAAEKYTSKVRATSETYFFPTLRVLTSLFVSLLPVW
jgi:hypothetical protein